MNWLSIENCLWFGLPLLLLKQQQNKTYPAIMVVVFLCPLPPLHLNNWKVMNKIVAFTKVDKKHWKFNKFQYKWINLHHVVVVVVRLQALRTISRCFRYIKMFSLTTQITQNKLATVKSIVWGVTFFFFFFLFNFS